MRSTTAAVCVVMVGLTVHVAAQDRESTKGAALQDKEERWAHLEAARGQIVSVESMSRTKTTGTLLQVEAQSLSLNVAGAEVRVDRAQVRRVTSERRDSVKNGFITGAVIGAGMAAGSSCYVRDRKCGNGATAAFIAVGAAIWAAIGVAIDASISKRVTLYQVPRPAKRASTQPSTITQR